MRESSFGCYFRFLRHAWLLILPGILGCATPDTWHDIEAKYEDAESRSDFEPVDSNRVPRAVWSGDEPLPGIKDGSVSLSLEQAVMTALQRNRELAAEQFRPVTAGTFELLERGRYDPELFAEATYAEETASETARSTGERFTVEGKDEEARAGIRQALPLGTELEASAAWIRSTSDRTPEQQEAYLGLEVTQALLEGFGPAVNLVDIRLAMLESEASRFELKGFTETLVADVETAYWRYVLAGEQIAIFEESLDIARRQLDEVEQRIEVGSLPRNAAAAARAEVARRDQALIEARSAWASARLRLLRLVHASGAASDGLHIEAISQPRTDTDPLTGLEERVALAEQSRPDLQEARLRLASSRLEVVRTRNGLLPRLDVFIRMGKTGYAESFGDSFSNIDDDTYEFSAGLTLRADLGNRSAKARDIAARATAEQAEAAIENLAHLVRLDVRLAWNEVERTRQQIQASAVTRELQEQTLKAERERFEVGASTPLLLAQAQRDLLVSQLAEVESIVLYRIALVELYRAEGSLLERRGISIQP